MLVAREGNADAKIARGFPREQLEGGLRIIARYRG
jgi:hypothetical protein